MDIKPYDKTIRDLLGSKRQFIIPRFQREYSWDNYSLQCGAGLFHGASGGLYRNGVSCIKSGMCP